MDKTGSAGVAVYTKYRVIYFPFAERIHVGDIVLVKVFGIPMYKRVGKAKSLFRFVWGPVENG